MSQHVNKLLAAAVAALCAGVVLNADAAEKKKEKTIADLATRPVVVQPDQKVEASSQRLACVSTAISGVPELIRDGDNGLLVPPDDVVALAAAIQRAIRDPALRTRLGAAAETRVRTAFDYHASVRQLAELFEQARQEV